MQHTTLSTQQIQYAVNAGIQLLVSPSTLIPGNLRHQISDLERILVAVSSGSLVVASPDQLTVDSLAKQIKTADDGLTQEPEDGEPETTSE